MSKPGSLGNGSKLEVSSFIVQYINHSFEFAAPAVLDAISSDISGRLLATATLACNTKSIFDEYLTLDKLADDLKLFGLSANFLPVEYFENDRNSYYHVRVVWASMRSDANVLLSGLSADDLEVFWALSDGLTVGECFSLYSAI